MIVAFVRSYGLGGEHYCMVICDCPHTYILLEILELTCTDCSFVLIVVLDFVFLPTVPHAVVNIYIYIYMHFEYC